MTQDDLETILASVPEDKRPATVCAILGHSHVVDSCFGYVTCARCNQTIGDTLGGVFDLSDKVIVGHACDTCRGNYEKLGWEHKYLTPDPFPEEAA